MDDFRFGTLRTRLGDESGAGAVEMALITPILLLFLAGIFDFGLIFNNLMGLRQGTGAGVRQAIVAQPGSDSACPLIGVSSANLSTKKLICLAKDAIDLGQADTRIMVAFPGVKTRGGSLILCAQYPLDSATQLFDPILNGVLRAKVQMRIEQDLSAFGNASETALPGGDWVWCT